MIKAITLTLLAAIFLLVASCSYDNNDSATPPIVPTEIPTAAVQPGTMLVSELLSIVNDFLEFTEGWELGVEYAEVWDDVNHNELIYVFDYGDFEIVLFADMDSDTFKYGYLRTRNTIMEFNTLLEVASIAGAFLKALEPNEYSDMLVEILGFEDLDIDENVEFFDLREIARISIGEVWGMMFHEGRLFNIFPKEDAVYFQ